METHEAQATRKVKEMTRREIIQRAIEGKMRWIDAADVCRVTPRQMLRLRERYLRLGIEGLRDGRTGKRQPTRIEPRVATEVCRLKREVYPDFSMRHFHRFAVTKHKLKLSYTWTRNILEREGIVEKAPSRGRHRRKRERRPMVGMMMHLDGSTHLWVAGLPARDLIVMLDDADGRILYGRFVEQEGTHSTLAAIEHVVKRHGRFCELYTDRGSHFCRTTQAGAAPDDEQNGQVTRALRALGIRQILARSPEARGRSERAFGTIQDQLVPELRVAGIRDYDAANAYLEMTYIPAFNQRHTVKPAEAESAFVRIVGIDLKRLLSVQHERVVRNDNTVVLEKLVLQLPARKERMHFARCPVTVHEFLDGTLGVSFRETLVATFTREGKEVTGRTSTKRRAA